MHATSSHFWLVFGFGGGGVGGVTVGFGFGFGFVGFGCGSALCDCVGVFGGAVTAAVVPAGTGGAALIAVVFDGVLGRAAIVLLVLFDGSPVLPLPLFVLPAFVLV